MTRTTGKPLISFHHAFLPNVNDVTCGTPDSARPVTISVDD